MNDSDIFGLDKIIKHLVLPNAQIKIESHSSNNSSIVNDGICLGM